ncbi:MAG: AMP-binding protein, partial [bacterium]|nr:AMP-binding protein [bacterium]
YIIYTSGTSGTPKGTIIEHRNIVRLLFNDKNLFDFNQQDTWTMFHSYCFDFSVWEMYGALLYGGRLITIPKDTARDTEEFYKLLETEGVTVLNQTPSAFYNLIGEAVKQYETAPQREDGLKLRYIIFGGEALNPAKLKPWFEIHPATRLINMYGITETTVHVTYKEIGEVELRSTVSN